MGRKKLVKIYISPRICGRKCQGKIKWRMVLDFRKLNEKKIGDSYPLPNINDIIDSLGSAKYFSVFDLATGFRNI